MRFLVAAALAATILLVAGSEKPDPRETVVEMTGNRFNPIVVDLSVGDTVTWVNRDKTRHNIVIPELEVRSEYLSEGETFSLKVTAPGAMEYWCQPHKSMGMTGRLRIKDGNDGKQAGHTRSN